MIYKSYRDTTVEEVAILEGVDVSSTPSDSFIKDVKAFIKALDNNLKDMKIHTGVLKNKEDKLENSNTYFMCIEKAYDNISKKKSKCKISINLNALDRKATFWNEVYKAITDCGYTFKERTIGNRLMGNHVAYKQIDKDHYSVAIITITNTLYTYYGAPAGHDKKIGIVFKCADANEKTRKELKLNESSIFESTSFI